MNYSIFSKNRGFTHTPKILVCGFTLVELIVVMAIATVIMTALIIQQSQWNDSLTVNTQAYELALMIRQAQIYSLGVREDSSSGGDKFDTGYGVYFDSDNTRYVFFADKNDANKGKYIAGVDNIIETKTFARGVTIDRFCGLNNGGQERCSPDAGNIDSLHISFFRPEPKANILLLNNGGNQSNSVNPPAIIYLKSTGEKISSVRVETNGQVSVTQ